MSASKSDAPFTDRVALVWGGLHETVQGADDPDLAMADFFQVTLEQLRAWRAAEGRHRCAGTTTRRHDCRNHASVVIDYDPRVWASRPPLFCPAHAASPHDPASPRSDLPAPAPQVDGQPAATEDDGQAMAR